MYVIVLLSVHVIIHTNQCILFIIAYKVIITIILIQYVLIYN